ncbi:phage virion morphogenesis protein [Roseovarius ramblicola]
MTLSLDAAPLDAALGDAIRRATDMTPLMRRIGNVLETSVSERFEQSKGPDGGPWPVSIRAREEGGQTLIDSARLRDSIVTEVEPRAVEIGSSLDYAATHQFGATIKPRDAKALAFRLPGGQFVTVGQVEIPARPFLGFDARDEADIGDTVEAYFREAFQ